MTAEPLTRGAIEALREKCSQYPSWAGSAITGLIDTVDDRDATIARLTAELAAEKGRADRNAELVGVHDPTGRDHMEDAARLAVENDELRAELAAARNVIRKVWITGERLDEDDLAVVDATRAALDQETTG